MPVVLPAEQAVALGAAEIAPAAALYAEAGGVLLLGCVPEGEAVRALGRQVAAAPAGALAIALEVRPGSDAEPATALIAEAGAALGYLRLYGGGPETVAQGGAGVGALMARLALARFGGPLVLDAQRLGHPAGVAPLALAPDGAHRVRQRRGRPRSHSASPLNP